VGLVELALACGGRGGVLGWQGLLTMVVHVRGELFHGLVDAPHVVVGHVGEDVGWDLVAAEDVDDGRVVVDAEVRRYGNAEELELIVVVAERLEKDARDKLAKTEVVGDLPGSTDAGPNEDLVAVLSELLEDLSNAR